MSDFHRWDTGLLNPPGEKGWPPDHQSLEANRLQLRMARQNLAAGRAGGVAVLIVNPDPQAQLASDAHTADKPPQPSRIILKTPGSDSRAPD